ncbi:40S ribosomal protein S4, Y isoform 1, partial [Galemys pyrenaicus]
TPHGPKKHLKHIAAPKHWILDKLTRVHPPGPVTKYLPLIMLLFYSSHLIALKEANCPFYRVRKIMSTKEITDLVTHELGTTHYPDPFIKGKDTNQVVLETGKFSDFIRFDTGNLNIVTGGANMGNLMLIGTALPPTSPTFLLLAKTNLGFLSQKKSICLTIAAERDRDWKPDN